MNSSFTTPKSKVPNTILENMFNEKHRHAKNSKSKIEALYAKLVTLKISQNTKRNYILSNKLLMAC